MKVKDLKKLLKNIDDDVEIFLQVPGNLGDDPFVYEATKVIFDTERYENRNALAVILE